MRTVLYHNDADGFGAAYAVSKRYPGATFIPVQHGQLIPPIAKETESLIIVDFSYSRAVLEELATQFSDILVLDHHKTAEVELEGLPYVVFDSSRSGCRLAWDYFNGGDVPDILLYVEDRDLWKFQYESSHAVNLFIGTLPRTFEAWDSFNLSEAKALGAGMLTLQRRQVAAAVENAYNVEGVPTVMCQTNVSEVGHALLEKYPEAGYVEVCFMRGDVRMVHSLRSRGDTDVSEIARTHGGGGHKAAASYVV
jgi:oligoribonuclease NrnB/cAMP/cGMP phosphodiesterase (DHH superfamily)